ncbi:hypothetical protein V8C42DRAFT_318833 [Trichoderma barbatum]
MRYVKKAHDFTNPFSCPECRHLGLGECKIEANPCAWSNYVEQMHGRIYALNLLPQTIKRAYCPLCGDFFAARGFTQYLNKKHLGDFSRLF